jgi:hypothetical protein
VDADAPVAAAEFVQHVTGTWTGALIDLPTFARSIAACYECFAMAETRVSSTGDGCQRFVY